MALDMSQSSNEIKSIIKDWIKQGTDNVHTALPGKFVSYSSGSNRASVQPVGKFKTQDGRNLAYPVIHNVPVQFPTGQGGTAGITFPIAVGDGCLLIFQESQVDDFLSKEKGDSPDPRKHSLNDCIAIPGVYPGAAPSVVSNPNDVCLFQGGALLKLNSGSFSGNVGGTSFSFGGGDLVVNGVSLCNHTHPGCQGGSTGQPQ